LSSIFLAVPDALEEHREHHQEDDFHLVIVSVSKDQWYATDTGDSDIPDELIESALIDVVENMQISRTPIADVLQTVNKEH